jgi:glutaredoxin
MSDNPLPILYVKTGCPWCAQVRQVLDDAGHRYEERNVSDDDAHFAAMRHLSGQTKAPVLDWHGEVLADFGAVELIPFLAACGLAIPD